MRLLDGMCTFKFAFILHLMEKMLLITHDLSQALQTKDKDIINVLQATTTCSTRSGLLQIPHSPGLPVCSGARLKMAALGQV
ncbi:unnamed protein product [Lampetra planeri]